MSTIAAQIDEPLKPGATPAGRLVRLPQFLFLAGAVSLVVAVGKILATANDAGGLSWKQIALIAFSAMLWATAAAWDVVVGPRQLVLWWAETKRDPKCLTRFVGLTIELALLVAIIREFQIGNTAFSQVIAVLTLIGFAIHYFLPASNRLHFFLFLSLVGIWTVFGLVSAAWLIGFCLLMIGICHLPVPFPARITLLVAGGAFLGLCRVGRIHGPWPAVIWPLVGSILMFRLIVYLYDLRHSKEKFSLSATLSYFFLLPNIVFPLFPVVDYRTFRRSFYDTDQYEIYQRGMQWVFRGVTQLILYRVVYNYFTMSPNDVATPAQLVRFLVANFALYLNVSGSFHLIVGILHLFGFHLPETNHRYFLSASFTDFWRRINIYWKDFMMKVFYYPAYFRLRKLGETTALVLSTLFIFFITWFLHAYQWFWLRGSFITSAQDALFWAILGILVVANSLYEMKYGRKRKLGKTQWSFATFAPAVLRTTGTMALICIIWSLWTSLSVSEWLSLWYLPGKKLSASLGSIGMLLFLGVSVEGVSRLKPTAGQIPQKKKQSFLASVITASCLSFLIYLAGNPAIYSRFGATTVNVVRHLKSDNLNQHDATLVQRGYYEDLKVERFDSQLWDIYMKRPTDWKPIGETEAARQTGDLQWIELRPFSAIQMKGATFHTNRWGMRDQDYEQEKKPGTYRYALVGASMSMGSGVGDNQTFESLVEKRLNAETDHHGEYSKYEILNFSVGGYSPLQYLWQVEHKIDAFQPDALLYIAHGDHDEERIGFFLTKFVREGVDLQYDYLKDVVRQAGIDRNTPQGLAVKRLQPHAREVLSWVYRRIVADCRQRGMVPIWIYLETLEEWQMPQASATTHIQLAQDAGFTTIDLSHWYGNHNIASLKVAEWDAHPNAQGHQMIAEQLYQALRETSKTVPVGFPGGLIDQGPAHAVSPSSSAPSGIWSRNRAQAPPG